MVWRTTFITISTCFLLGTTFTHWIADHDVLWKRPLTDEAIDTSIKYYSILNSAPRGMLYGYFAMIGLTLLSAGGRMIKVFRGGKGEVVFDGGSVVLLAAIVHTQLTEAFPNIVSIPSPLPKSLSPLLPELSSAVRELATDNIKCAVMLTGVMLLQGGRYYSKRPSRRPYELAEQPTEIDSGTEASSPEVRAVRPGTPWNELTEEQALDLNE